MNRCIPDAVDLRGPEESRTMTSEWRGTAGSWHGPEEFDDHPAGERRYLAPCDCSACAVRILENVPDDDIVEEEA